jgi:general secretion pathway protein I
MNKRPPQFFFRSKRHDAFTLIEVMVALAIFAFSAITLAASYLHVLNAYDVAARTTQSDEDLTFARAQLMAEPDRKLVEEGNDFESTKGRRVQWSATIASTSINDLFTVTFVCEITDPAYPDPEKVTQTFTLLRPTWSEPTERGDLFEKAKARILELQGKQKQ